MFDEDNKLNTNFGLDILLKIINKGHNKAYFQYLLFCSLGLNIIFWLSVIFLSREIFKLVVIGFELAASSGSESDSDSGSIIIVFIIGLIIVLPFSLGFLIVYSILSILQPEVEISRKMDSEFMAGYSYIANEDKKSKIYMLSGAAGAVNLFALLILFIFFNQYY